MKKGFTLVEIIISISLILIVGVSTSFFIFNINNDYTKEEKKFLNDLKNSSLVYLENVKNDKSQKQILKPYDSFYLRLSDLIENGLLKEEIQNPFTNVSLKEEKNFCIKVFMNEDYEIEIEYKVDDKFCNSYLIYLEQNDTTYSINLMESNDVALIHSTIDNNIIDKIQNGLYNFENPKEHFGKLLISADTKEKYDGSKYKFTKPGYYLTDYKGVEIETTESDWEITKEWRNSNESPKRGEWEITYSIVNESLNHNNSIIPKKIIVELIDEDAPGLYCGDSSYIYDSNNNSYNYYPEYNKELIDVSYDGEKFSLTYVGAGYWCFDNYSGYECTIGECDEGQILGDCIGHDFYDIYLNERERQQNLSTYIFDDYYIERWYNLNLQFPDSDNPEPWYWESDFYCDYSYERADLYEIRTTIELYSGCDDKGFGCTLSYALYDSSGNYIGDLNNSNLLCSESYKLKITATDDFGNSSTIGPYDIGFIINYHSSDGNKCWIDDNDYGGYGDCFEN